MNDGGVADHRPVGGELARPERAASIREIHQQNRQRRLVHLDAVPIRRAVEPHVLAPVAVGLLSHHQVAPHPPGVAVRADCEESARGFHEVARPHHVIAAEIVVSLVEPPRNRQAGDDPAAKRLRLVDAEHGRAEFDQRAGGRIQARRRLPLAVPSLPHADVLAGDVLKAGDQAVDRALRRLRGGAPETQRQHERAVAGREIDLAGHRDVAVLGSLVGLDDAAARFELLPAVREPDEANRSGQPRRRTRQRQGVAVALGEQHRRALVVTDPGGVAGPAVAEMRRQQRVQTIVRQRALQRGESHPLQDDIGGRIGNDVLVYLIAAVERDVPQVKCGNTVRHQRHARECMPLFLGAVRRAVGHDQSEIARARRVDARVVDFVEDAVAEREPDATRRAERGADAALGARGPARRDAGPARGVDHDPIRRTLHRHPDYTSAASILDLRQSTGLD